MKVWTVEHTKARFSGLLDAEVDAAGRVGHLHPGHHGAGGAPAGGFTLVVPLVWGFFIDISISLVIQGFLEWIS